MLGLKNKWKGLLLCLAIALPSWFLGKMFPIVGGAVIAIIAGMILTGFIKNKANWNRASNSHRKRYFSGP